MGYFGVAVYGPSQDMSEFLTNSQRIQCFRTIQCDHSTAIRVTLCDQLQSNVYARNGELGEGRSKSKTVRVHYFRTDLVTIVNVMLWRY